MRLICLFFALSFLFITSESNAVFVYNYAEYDDKAALQKGQETYLNGVVIIRTNKGIGSGFLMKFPEALKHLNGKIVLTAAHVIKQVVSTVHLNGAPVGALNVRLLKDPLATKETRAHPEFEFGNEAKRQYDYGIIILENAVANINLLSLSEVDVKNEASVIIAGYGTRNISKDTIDTENDEEDNRRRAFESRVIKNKNLLLAQLEPNKQYNYAFPWTGDSGGPVLLKDNASEFISIVSGLNTETGQFVSACPTLKDILALIPAELQKTAAAESGAAAKPETAATGSGMAVTTAVKPESAAAAGGGGGGAAVNVGMDDGKSKAANLSAPKPATGGAAAAGGGATPPPVTAKPAQPVVDDATPAAGK